MHHDDDHHQKLIQSLWDKAHVIHHHHVIKCISSQTSLLTSQKRNTKLALRVLVEFFWIICGTEKELETSQKQKLNLSISMCASWRQCMMKPLEKSGIKSFSRQQETITFQVSLASRITRLIWHLQSEIDAESFRSPSSGSGELPRDHYSALKQEGSQIVGS